MTVSATFFSITASFNLKKKTPTSISTRFHSTFPLPAYSLQNMRSKKLHLKPNTLSHILLSSGVLHINVIRYQLLYGSNISLSLASAVQHHKHFPGASGGYFNVISRVFRGHRFCVVFLHFDCEVIVFLHDIRIFSQKGQVAGVL